MSNLVDVVSNGSELTPYLGIFGKRSGPEVHAGDQHTEKYFHWEPREHSLLLQVFMLLLFKRSDILIGRFLITILPFD